MLHARVRAMDGCHLIAAACCIPGIVSQPLHALRVQGTVSCAEHVWQLGFALHNAGAHYNTVQISGEIIHVCLCRSMHDDIHFVTTAC